MSNSTTDRISDRTSENRHAGTDVGSARNYRVTYRTTTSHLRSCHALTLRNARETGRA